MICKVGHVSEYSNEIFHKHKQEEPVYHLHRRKGTIWGPIEEIKKHDQYQISGSKDIFENEK